MKHKKNPFSTMLASMLVFVCSFAVVSPNCLGWFYEPEKPEVLK